MKFSDGQLRYGGIGHYVGDQILEPQDLKRVLQCWDMCSVDVRQPIMTA